MTAPARQADYRKSLEQRLEQHCPRATSAPAARVRWLSAQLENYIERLLGFAALPDVPQSFLLKGDLFAAVEVGISMLDAELKSSNATPTALTTWTNFLHIVGTIQQPGASLDPDALRASFRAFIEAIPPA